MVEEDSSWPYFGIWWIESWLPVQSLATDLSLSHIVPVGIFIFQFVLGLLLVPGHLYEIGTFPPDPEGFSSEPHAAMSVPRVTPFPPFFTWTSSVSHQSHKSSIQISLFWQPVFLSGLASSYYPSGILQIRDWGEGQASSCFYSTPSPELPWLTFCSAALQGHSFHVPLPFYHIKNTWKLHKDFHSHEWRRNTFW